MGQINQLANSMSANSRLHHRSSTLIHQRGKISSKAIKFSYLDESKEIIIEDSSMTCGWLLSEAIRLFPEIFPIVGLKSFQRADVIDIWLQEFDRNINIIRDGTVLCPIIGQKISKSLSLEWFEPICAIGKGGFSSVYLVRKKDNGYLYAMKVIQKSYIIQENKIKQVLAECSILKRLSHPFIITLRWAFQTVK